ncbi:MAG TPA: site-2 protease family protein [Longimicrobiaceae bacterium]|nr:site-2 protease family protein [Longimicrobiaceae bacterium]
MRWSIKVARIAGIDVKIHLTFLLLLTWIGVTYYLRGGAPVAIEGLIFILLLFASVLLHEFGHALAARRYGIPTYDITLLPIGGVARLVRMPDDPRQELVVALAGPAVNVGIALALLLVLGWVGDPSELVMRLEDPAFSMAAKLTAANLFLVLFNLVPAFPMDGGRVLRAALAMRMNYVRATQIAASIGQGIAFLFGFLGLFYNPLLIFIALFVYLGASQEAAVAEVRNVTECVPISAAMVTEFRTLPLEATLNDAVEALLRTHQHEFPVVDVTRRVRGILTRDALIAALTRGGPHQPVTAAMRTDLPSVSWHTPFEEAFVRMQECRCPVLPVTDDHDRLVGMITPENVGEMLMVHGALSREQRPFWRPAAGDVEQGIPTRS